MTSRVATLALVAVLAVGVSPAWAHDEFRFVATVVKMDVAKNVVTIAFEEEHRKQTAEVAILASTEITRDKKKVSKSDLKAGIYVVVDALGHSYEDLEAVAIRIVPKPK